MKIEKTDLDDVIIVHPSVFKDERGFFMEVHRRDLMLEYGMDLEFVQDNQSRSSRNTIRGLHFQWSPPQGKLMRIARGKAFVVAVDIRKNSPNLGRWIGIEISEEDNRQVWAPAGFARGFCALSDIVDVQYKCTGIYNPECESGILWEDPRVGIKWPTDNPKLSPKDARARTLDDWLKSPDSNNFMI